jgi:hypothetical protein
VVAREAGTRVDEVEHGDDLQPVRFPELSWREADLAGSVDAVYLWVEGEMVRAAEWYLREKRSKARWSRTLRIAAVLFATAGAILPFVAANVDSVGFEWGYVALALAAGTVALDRFFGFSTSWMRFMATEIAIQQAVTQLQFDWAAILVKRGDRPVGPEEATALLAKLSEAAATMEDLIARETVAWADEFQSNISELRSLATQNPK